MATLRKSLIILLLAAMAIPATIHAQDKGVKEILQGTWMGRIQSGALYLRLVFNISLNDRDTLKASLESPDQGSVIIPLGAVKVSGDTVLIEAGLIGGKYTGVVKGEKRIDGKWEQMNQTFELNLEKQEGKFKLNRPQEPVPPFPYRSEEITFWNEKAGITLAGTITIPEGDGPFPAAVLISGSGPQNRDEELLGHKPFAVLADHLTRNGIVVLRYDDRGTAGSGGKFAGATSADLATDAGAALTYLLRHPSVDKNAAGLIGHSEGGLIAPMVAAGGADVAWIVSLAGPGVTGEEVIMRQSEDITRAMGSSEKDIEKATRINKKLYSIIRKTPLSEAAEPKVIKLLNKELKKMDIEQEVINERVNNVKISLLGDNYNWFRYFIMSDPAIYWQAVRCPVLVLNGGLDLQVEPTTNTGGIAAALGKGGNMDYEVKVFPELNHLFQRTTTGLPGEYGTIEETMSPEVLAMISGWIRKKTLGK